MSSSFARTRSTEAPMPGIEFTSRTKTVPIWRRDSMQTDGDQSTPLKRSHSTANPPPSPFDPKRENDGRPLFGDNVKYLFSPQIPARPQMPVHPPNSPWLWNNASTSTPAREPDIPDVDMRDAETSPSPAPAHEARRKEKERLEIVREGDENESPETRIISNAAVRRLERKRQSAGSLVRTRGGRGRYKPTRTNDEDESDDEEDEEGHLLVSRKTSNHYTLNMPGPVQPKSETPYILLGYLQFMFNLSLILVFLYLLVQFILTVQRDVEQRISEYSMEILQDISTCTTLYKTNMCDTNPIPAMTHQCAAWETCMSRDPHVVGRAKVGAEMLAEVVNGFVEPISWKTLAFTLTSLSFLTFFVNALLSLYRSKLMASHENADQIHTQPLQPHPSQLHLPMQPHFPMSHYGYMPPPTWRPSEAEELPTRRRRLDNGNSAAVQ